MEIKVVEYIIPMYGNKRIFPYGTVKVTDGEITKFVKFSQDNKWLKPSFTYNRKRYFMNNIGSIYSPKYILEGETK